jgi:hypothetical protein
MRNQAAIHKKPQNQSSIVLKDQKMSGANIAKMNIF